MALRSVLTAKPDDIPLHDATFDEFWRSRMPERMEERGDEGVASQDPDAQGQDMAQPQIAQGDEANADEDEEGIDMPLYSPVEVLAGRDFSSFVADEMVDIARAILLLARRLATRESRRYRSTQRGHAIDLRRTMRRNIKYGGTVVELAKKKRKIRKPKIVLICDVSRSMDTYSKFLLQFIYALQNTLGSRSAYFARLTRVTGTSNQGNLHPLGPDFARVPGLVGQHPHRRKACTPSILTGRCAVHKHTIADHERGSMRVTRACSSTRWSRFSVARREVITQPRSGTSYRPLARGMSAARHM
jgi:hypothetical protein